MKIAIDDKCSQQFKRLKFDKVHRYIIFKIENEHVVLEKVGQREQNWNSFLTSLPLKDYRYGVFDLEYKTNDGMNCSKLFFCNWLADGTPIKTKLLYATGKESFKTYLDLNSKEICINTIDDMNEAQLIKEFNK